jgi:hypothetical protein
MFLPRRFGSVGAVQRYFRNAFARLWALKRTSKFAFL